jgi:undecaprenyl diphosphate synthase
MHANNVKIRWIGRGTRAGSRIPAIVRREIEKSTRLTADNTGLNFTVAFDYGGRQELVEAARAIARDQPDAVTAHTVREHLYAPELPPVDLMIRTSGEARISNFLLWEGVGAQLYVTPTLWPDFGADELARALTWWRERVA